jgi:hypothetical protein
MVFQNGVPVSGVGGIPQAFPQIVAQPAVQMIPMMQELSTINHVKTYSSAAITNFSINFFEVVFTKCDKDKNILGRGPERSP